MRVNKLSEDNYVSSFITTIRRLLYFVSVVVLGVLSDLKKNGHKGHNGDTKNTAQLCVLCEKLGVLCG